MSSSCSTTPMGEVKHMIMCINERHQTTFTLQKRFQAGWDRGAYGMANEKGEQFVLKSYPYQPYMLRRLELARIITNHLSTKSALIPLTILIDIFPNTTIVWVISMLPGIPTTQLSEHHLEYLLALNELQAEQAPSQEKNWTNYIRNVVFCGEAGWSDMLRCHSSASHGLLVRLERLVAGTYDCCQKTCDIVHGDFNYSNILVDGEQLSGIVDWDAAGCGDRLIDLVYLLAEAHTYENVSVYYPLRTYILAHITRECLFIYIAYKLLIQISWSIIQACHPNDIALEIAKAHTLLDDLENASHLK